MVARDFVAVQDLDHWFRATRETAELRAETMQMGYSLLRLCLELVAYLWSWLENQVMAALKAVPLGQTDGHRPFVFSNLKTGEGLETIVAFIEKQGLMK